MVYMYRVARTLGITRDNEQYIESGRRIINVNKELDHLGRGQQRKKQLTGLLLISERWRAMLRLGVPSN